MSVRQLVADWSDNTIINPWAISIRHAIALGDADAAYRLTRGLCQRIRELGRW